MKPRINESLKRKIGREFSARLANLKPDEKVRVIVLLRIQESKKSAKERYPRARRQKVIKAVRRSTQKAMGEVEDILGRFGGQRLEERPDVLGSLPVETTVAGVKELVKSDLVKAILEDQEIHSVQ